MLSHQKLKVYGKGLAVVASLAEHSGSWDKRHARGRSDLGMAEGSAVKAAVCLDLCASKAELDSDQRLPKIQLLGRVASMLRALSGGRSE